MAISDDEIVATAAFPFFGEAEARAFGSAVSFERGNAVPSPAGDGCFRTLLPEAGVIGRTGSIICVAGAEGARDGAALGVATSGMIVDVDSGVGARLGSGEVVSLGDDREAVSLGEADGDVPGERERFGFSFFGGGLALLWSFFCGVGDGPVKNLLIF